jgi:hypothetical protein
MKVTEDIANVSVCWVQMQACGCRGEQELGKLRKGMAVLFPRLSLSVYRRVIHLLSDGKQGIIELLKLQQISEAQLAWIFLLHSIAITYRAQNACQQ